MAQPTTLEFASVTQLYVSYFGRTPDAAGLTFWATALANGASLDTISEGFLLAPEGQELYPATQTAEAFVEAFYESTLGRAADSEGLAFWLNVLTAAGGVESAAARALLVGKINEVVTAPLPDGEPIDSQAALDRALFANKVEYSLYVATQTDLTGPNAPAANFSLSKITADSTSVTEQKAAADLAQDSGTPIGVTPPAPGGGVVTPDVPLTFVRTYDELSADGATVIGGTAFDTLAITTNQNIGATPANVQNVERIVVYTAPNVEVISVDAARFAGAQVFLGRSEAGLVFNGLTAGQSGQVDAKGANGDAISNGSSTFAYASGVAAGAVVVSQGTTAGKLSVTGDALSSVALSSQGFALNKVSGLALSDTVTSLTINALSSFSLAGAPLTGGAANNLAVVVTGAGRVDLGVGSSFLNGNIASLDASANTGGVVARVSGHADEATTVLGGAGHDDFRLTGGTTFVEGSVISLGKGNDYVGGTGAIFEDGVVVDGGDGLDVISAYALNQGNAAAFINFERVSVAGDLGTDLVVDLGWLTGSTITSLGLGGGNSLGGVTATNVQLSQTLNITGTTLSGVTTLKFANAGGDNDAYNIAFNTVTPSASPLNASAVSVEGIEVLNLHSGSNTGNTTEIIISDAALKTLNITGNFPIKVSFAAETTLTSTIDASAASGSLVLDTTRLVADVDDGLTVIGSSSAANYLSIAQKATVTGGSGADIFLLKSSLHVTAADDEISAKLVSITNFAAGDSINVGSIAEGSSGTSLYNHGALLAETLNEAAGVAVLAAAQSSSAKEFAAFQWGASTYVVADIDSNGVFGAGDVVVELVGQPNLGNVLVNVAEGTLTNVMVPLPLL